MANRNSGRMGKGSARGIREDKRAEAEERQVQVAPERTKKFRRTRNVV